MGVDAALKDNASAMTDGAEQIANVECVQNNVASRADALMDNANAPLAREAAHAVRKAIALMVAMGTAVYRFLAKIVDPHVFVPMGGVENGASSAHARILVVIMAGVA